MNDGAKEDQALGQFDEVDAVEPQSVQELAHLIPGDAVSQPNVKPWHLNNFAVEEDREQKEAEQKAYETLRKKLEPEIIQQTELLKKEAYEEAKQSGFDAGYEEGRRIGEEEGREISVDEARQALEPKIRRMEAMLKSLDQPYRLLEKQVFASLSDLAVHLAEEVIEQQIEQEPEWIMKIIQESVTLLNDSESPIEIRLNPSDCELISEQRKDFENHWKVTCNDQIPVGTCQVKQGVSSVEHNWKNRFQAMRVKLQAQAVAEQGGVTEPAVDSLSAPNSSQPADESGDASSDSSDSNS